MAVTSEVSQDGTVLVITITGRFDFGAHQDFRNAYERVNAKPERYEVNLGEATYLDSSALGMLLLLRDHAGGESAKVKLTNSSADVGKILAISNFDKLFEIEKPGHNG
ncbi:STAS domain-containing protein [Pseudomonas typographi]|uniref:STAS domain-containing protein n=1 Tax=Pseudomonas typographi TaxID=2715964 RepID=A0ABR7Z4H8_9PSED|nr:STAS domain-containing protein [Pseudomonas typographi]MBD1553952.1 STAS domain-containing protein [Pseudomonas typographi]MBD1588031.1 STAS domain-containing protein [Pseudomonas typographi]MBD1600415.1 STAS domain-containing protein [Pseudomonas typographi]